MLLMFKDKGSFLRFDFKMFLDLEIFMTGLLAYNLCIRKNFGLFVTLNNAFSLPHIDFPSLGDTSRIFP